MADVVNSINKKFVYISNRVTDSYTSKLGLPCDLYFPIYEPYNNTTKYREMKIFAPHQSPTYASKPDVEKTLFYIPYLIKKDAMNSSELEFDSFYTADEIDRPFIETTKKRELPISTKVVVYQGRSIMKFFVDKKLVVTGADGMMLLRMYLAPLAKDNDEEEIEQEETTIEGTDYSPEAVSMNLPKEDEDDNQFTDEELEAIKVNEWENEETNSSETPTENENNSPSMNIPTEDEDTNEFTDEELQALHVADWDDE